MPDKQWSEMTPQEKRAERKRWWLEPEGVQFESPAAEQGYKERVQRMIDAYNVEEPDRVPVSLPIGSIPAYLYGGSYHACSYDYRRAVDAWDKFNQQILDADGLGTPAMIFPGRVYEAIGYKLYKWPGGGLDVNAEGIQFVEGEYMTVDEYDKLIANPSDFWMRTYMPRIFDVFEPWQYLNSFTTIIEAPGFYFAPFGRPDMQKSLDRLKQAGDELNEFMKIVGPYTQKTLAMGYPGMRGGMAKAPFDTVGDTLRGTKGVIMDMRRCPDKLLEAIDVVTQFTIEQTIAAVDRVKGHIVMFPLHKGADGWMSDAHFQKFYWASLRKVINALIDEGIQVNLFAEGSYETRLDLVNEFPRGTVSWLFDKTDMGKAKKALGDKCCIAGNVPTSLIVTGTPQQVKDYCRGLIETCAPGGGYVLAAGAQAEKGSVENLRAMIEAAREYGTYKK